MRFRDFGQVSRFWITVAATLSVTAIVIAGLFVLIKLHDGKPTVSEPISTAPSLFPELTGRVVDEANILSENDTIELAAKLKALEDKNTDQVVVVTVISLRGYSIDEYANRLGNHWAVGHGRKITACFLWLPPTNTRSASRWAGGLSAF